MKKISGLMVISAVCLVLLSAYGFFQVLSAASQYGISAGDVDSLMSLGRAFGISGHMSFTEQLRMFALENRVILLISAGVCVALGLLMNKKAEA